jgi:hypothetical protein
MIRFISVNIFSTFLVPFIILSKGKHLLHHFLLLEDWLSPIQRGANIFDDFGIKIMAKLIASLLIII